MTRTGSVILAGVLLFFFVAASPQSEERHGNAEVRHQQLIAAQLQKPSMQEQFMQFLNADENMRAMVIETLRNALHDDPAWTMECTMMEAEKEATCCGLTETEKNSGNEIRHSAGIRGNAEVRHRQLIAAQFEKPSIQEQFTHFLAEDENLRTTVITTLQNAMRDYPAWTMECTMMAEGEEVSCCSLSEAKVEFNHEEHH